MDSNTSDIIRVRFIGMLSLQRVVVENTDLRGQDFSQNECGHKDSMNLHVIRTSDDPVFPWYKNRRSDWKIANLEMRE